jgi:hypothetical protein
MTFGPFDTDLLWEVEESQLYQKLRGAGVCSVEFMLKKGSQLLLVEAKPSAPNPQSTIKPEAFDQYIDEIVSKFLHSLALLLAVHNKRQEEPIAEAIRLDVLAKPRLILVIKAHQDSWLEPVRDALQTKLKPYLRIWNVHDECIQVLNEAMANKKDSFCATGTPHDFNPRHLDRHPTANPVATRVLALRVAHYPTQRC